MGEREQAVHTLTDISLASLLWDIGKVTTICLQTVLLKFE